MVAVNRRTTLVTLLREVSLCCAVLLRIVFIISGWVVGLHHARMPATHRSGALIGPSNCYRAWSETNLPADRPDHPPVVRADWFFCLTRKSSNSTFTFGHPLSRVVVAVGHGQRRPLFILPLIPSMRRSYTQVQYMRVSKVLGYGERLYLHCDPIHLHCSRPCQLACTSPNLPRTSLCVL